MQSARERAEAQAGRSPRYGFEYGQLMLMFLIGLAFCVISPLVLPFTLAFFLGAWMFWRYQALYVLVRKYESGATAGLYVTCMVLRVLWVMWCAWCKYRCSSASWDAKQCACGECHLLAFAASSYGISRCAFWCVASRRCWPAAQIGCLISMLELCHKTT